jgi:hypothetical protein
LCKACSKISIISSRRASDTYEYNQGFSKNFASEWPELCYFDRSIKSTLKIMKSLKYLLAVAALMGAFALSAQAHLEFVGAVSFESQPNNNPDSNLAALGGFVDTTGFVLCGNSDPPDSDFGNPITNPISVMAGSFLVVHYGAGKGGTPGGQLSFFHVVDGETSVDVPLVGPGPDGFGGISSIREFCPPGTVPDSGTTAMFLGSALTGLGLVRRYLKR